jgi:hypothetical protein
MVCGAGLLTLVLALSAPACSAGTSGVAVWTENGVAVRRGISDTQYPTLTSDGSNGSIITWYDLRSGYWEIYVQRMDSTGVPRWASNGVALRNIATSNATSPAIISDCSGGAIVAWHDDRFGDLDIYVQRVDSTGAPRWTANGVALRSLVGSDAQYPTIVSDGSGGAIVAWYDKRSGFYDIYAQRVDSTGVPQWTANGVALRSTTGFDAQYHTMTSDCSGGAIVTWHEKQSDGGYPPRYSSYIYAQRVDSTGTPRWAADGVTLRGLEGSDTLYPASTSDGSGGVIVTWYESRSDTSVPPGYPNSVFAQRVDSTGAVKWTVNGVALCTGSGGVNPTMTSDGSGGAIVTWADDRSGAAGIYAQRVDSAGVPQWTVNGVHCAGSSGLTAVTSDGSRGAIVTWGISGSYDIRAQRVDSSGVPQWSDDGVVLRQIAGSKGLYPTITSDGAGGAIVTWKDNRSNGYYDIYAQRVRTMTTYSITVDQPAHGTIAPAGTAGVVTVIDRSDQAFTIKPESGYHVTAVQVDGSGVGAVTATFAQDQQPTSTWYLAEGTTDYGFDAYINIENPNASTVTALVTYMTKEGPKPRAALTLPAMSQTVINPRDDIGSTDFSTKVECKEGKTICVDRRMTWTGAGAASQEGHSSVGVTSPAKAWYLAEGSSKWGFETWLLVQNPNATPATCTVTYMTSDAGPIPVTHTVPANTRASYSMEADIGQRDASIKVESKLPVIPERAMYRNNRREGHDSIGTTTPARDYYLAEGTTDWGFTTYVLVQNPNEVANKVTITYMTPKGPVAQTPFTVLANSRQTVRVNDVLPAKDLSIHVSGSLPLIAERAMYWDKGLGEACHDSIGMDSPHTTFYLPDGETANGHETWTLVQNPNGTPVTVQVSYLTQTGNGNVTKTETVGANSRKSFSMASHSGITGRASVIVTSKTYGKKIMVERAMYWNNRGAGTNTIGGFGD